MLYKGAGQRADLTNQLINFYINNAKISGAKFPLKVDKNGDLWWFTALDTWNKLGKPSKDIGNFCECGYYSLNYYDFIKNKNFLKKTIIIIKIFQILIMNRLLKNQKN